MADPAERFVLSVPVRLVAALVLAGAFAAFLTFDQSHWWRLKPDYAFGWLVPVLVGFLVVDRWPRLQGLARSPGESPLPKWVRKLSFAAAGLALAIGLLVFLFGALYRANEGPTQPGSFAMAVGFTGIVLGMVYLNSPDGVAPSDDPPGRMRVRRDTRFRMTALLLFPALIWMLSAPLMSAVENAISLFLLNLVVNVVFAVFSTLGLPLLQQGNVLILPHGQVGVAEACSGIRSLTGCLFAGSFLAAVFLDRFWKKALLIVLALGLAFLANLGRSLFLTSWAYAYGSEAIEGRLHDATGFAVLGLTTLLLLGLVPLFRASNWRRWLGLAAP